MLELMMILTGAAIGLIVGLMSKQEPEKPQKTRKHTVWDDDPFFGTPLQKVK